MTLFEFPDPRDEMESALAAGANNWPTGTTVGRKVATSIGPAPHIQVGWDGTPDEQSNREFCSVRVTVWGWKTPTGPSSWEQDESELTHLASRVRDYFLKGGSAAIWRYTRGTGRLAGVDPNSKVPFCTFNLTAETRPSAVT